MFKDNETINFKWILFLSPIILLIAHLTVNTYFQNLLLNVIALILVALLIFNETLNKNKIYLFIVLIYILSHFQFGLAQGGAFNIITFIIVIFAFINNNRIYEFNFQDRTINFLLTILIISNILGWIFKNHAGSVKLFQGIACFFAYIFMFNISRKICLSPNRMKIFLLTNILLVFYNFAYNVNNMLGFIRFKSLMISTSSDKMWGNIRGSSGIIGSSAIMGEDSLMCLIIFLSFYFSKNKLGKNKFLMIGILTSLANMVFSGSRSVLILSVLIILVYVIFINNKLIFRSFGKQSKVFVLVVFSTIFVSFFLLYFIDFTYLKNRLTFSDLATNEISYEAMVSGSAVHREWAFEVGRENLARESWWVGYGWGIGRVNRQAWFVNPHINRTSPHSMYFGIIPLFGWFGSIAFIGIILITIKRLFKFILRNRSKNNFLILLAISFLLIFIIRLFNGYKADIIYLPHYYMVFWIWLGLANSIPYTDKYNKKI